MTSPRQELQNSAIAPHLLDVAVKLVSDIEIDPITQEAIATPLDDALGYRYRRFGHQHRPNEQGFIFVNESGSVWQVKRGLGLPRDDGRSGQYLAPKGSGNIIYTPALPDEILRRICDRHQLNQEETQAAIASVGGFWPWVLTQPELPILVTEGAKKSLAALSQGHIAIALYGCRCGKSEDLAPYLAGRAITVAFDKDTKPKAIRDVNRGITALAAAVRHAGGMLTVAEWQAAQGKGIDDLIVQSGVARFEDAIAGATAYPLYKATQRLRNPLGLYKPDVHFNIPCLSKITPQNIPQTGIVVIESGMGTGKTKLIAQLLTQVEKGIAPGHRISLQQGLAKRLGLDYISETHDSKHGLINAVGLPTNRISLCWNSLLKIPYLLYEDGQYDLILDEVDQGFKHLLISSCCGRDGMRPGLVSQAIALIQGAKRIIAASATLSRAEIDLLVQLRDNQSPWILQNDYQGNHYPATLYRGQPGVKGSQSRARGAAVSEFMNRLDSGERGAIATDQKLVSKMLERMALMFGIEARHILRIDQETSSNERQQTFLSSLDKVQWLNDHAIQVLIYSPSMTSGVSIEGDYFNFVGGIFEGQTVAPEDALQQLGRVRSTVPRIVYAAARGRGDALAETHAEAYLQKSRRRALLFSQVTRRILPEQNEAIAQYIAQVSATRNAAMADFGSYLEAGLRVAGHQVTLNPECWHTARAEKLWWNWRDEVRAQDELDLLHSPILTAERAKWFRDKRSLTHAEALQLKRYDLCDFMVLDPESLALSDIQQDQKGKTRKAIARLENLLWEGLATDKDEGTWDKLTRWTGPVFDHDLPMAELTTTGAENLGIPELLQRCITATENEEGWHQFTPWLREFCDRVRLTQDVQIALGFRVNDAMTDAQILGQILARYGLKTQSRRVGPPGARFWLYQLDSARLDWLKAVLQRRAAQFVSSGFEFKATPLSFSVLEGVDKLIFETQRLANDPEKERSRDPINCSPGSGQEEKDADAA